MSKVRGGEARRGARAFAQSTEIILKRQVTVVAVVLVVAVSAVGGGCGRGGRMMKGTGMVPL